MAVSEEELQETRERLQEKQDQLIAIRATRTDNQNTVARELEKAQLDAEEARVDAELTETGAAAKITTIRAANKPQLDEAKSRLKAAVEANKGAKKGRETSVQSAVNSAVGDTADGGVK